MYSPMPLFWVGGFVYSLLACMHAGATLLCEETFDPGRTLDLLEREGATVAVGWPHYAKAMAEHQSFASRKLKLRSGNLYALLDEGVRPADPQLRHNSLGMTETGGPHSHENMEVDLPEALRGSFGRAVEGVEHRIVDPATGASLPHGERGEICVRGYNVMQGLYKQEREHVFDADGFYHTGDGGTLHEHGLLFFEGRLGEVIKTGGANVTPREIEVVFEAMDEVKEAYVVGLPDAERGQVVAAVAVLEAGTRLDTEEARGRLEQQLSAYKVPRHLWWMSHEELPFTDSGKIDRRSLKTQLVERLGP